MYWQNTQYLCTPALGLAAAAQHKDIFEVRGVWRYDKAEWNLLVFPHMTLCARVWRCVCPAGPYTCPALLQECHVSAMRQCSTNELWWERLGSAVGTLLPSLLSVPGNRSASGRGRPAARSLSEHQTKPLATRWVTRVNVGFSLGYSSPPSPPLPSWLHSRQAHCCEWRIEKRRTDTHRNKTVQVWELFACSFFLSPKAFISITSAYTGICAPVAPD